MIHSFRLRQVLSCPVLFVILILIDVIFQVSVMLNHILVHFATAGLPLASEEEMERVVSIDNTTHSCRDSYILHSLFSRIQVSVLLPLGRPLKMVFAHLGDPQRVKSSGRLQLCGGPYDCDLGPN